jgi:hypothetical protein
MKMCPSDIEVLIHYLVSREEHPRFEAPAVVCAINLFLGKGIFEDRVAGEIGYTSSYRVTARGIALVDMLCATPLPVSVWQDPRK